MATIRLTCKADALGGAQPGYDFENDERMRKTVQPYVAEGKLVWDIHDCPKNRSQIRAEFPADKFQFTLVHVEEVAAFNSPSQAAPPPPPPAVVKTQEEAPPPPPPTGVTDSTAPADVTGQSTSETETESDDEETEQGEENAVGGEQVAGTEAESNSGSRRGGGRRRS